MLNEEFVTRMQALLQDEYPAFEAALEQPQRRGVRWNRQKSSEEELKRWFPQLEKSPFSQTGWYLEEAEGLHPLHLSGHIYLQEPSASAPAELLEVQPDSIVLDMCAAPGSKTSQLAEKLESGLLISNEIDPRRAQVLLSNAERMGSANQIVTNMDTKTLCAQFPQTFDRILLDAPCSGEGMMKKHDEAREGWSFAKVRGCALIQEELLENAYDALAPDGILVYSTCTYAPEENEERIEKFLADHPDMELLEPGLDFVHEGRLPKTRRIYPMDGGEGQFLAKMKKTGGTKKELPELKNQTLPPEAAQFMKEQLPEGFPYYALEKGRDSVRVYGLNHPFVRFRKGRVLRQGVYLGEVVKKRFEPAHAFFMSAAYARNGRRRLELSLEELDRFLHGEAILKECPRGFTAVGYENLLVGFGKSDGRQLKNRLPRGLRLLPGSRVHL